MSGMLSTVPLIAAVLSLCLAADDRLGSVEFYGAAPHAVPDALRAALPLRPGMTLPQDDPSRERLLHQIEQAIKTHTGKPPADVSPVCCDSKGDWIVYIGIRGPRVLEPSPRPSRAARKTASPVLPQALLNTYRAMLEENVSAVRAGAAEDQSQGYSLSGYEPLRNLQISFRKRILAANSATIFNVLKRSADSEQRAAAATALGYLDASASQIQALVSAASDENSTVRNNALRALWALATVHAPLVLRDAPTAQMARLLRSGEWSDRNKALLLCMTLSESRDNRSLLDALKREVLPELREMSRWRNPGHSLPARLLLDRIGGL